MPLSRALTLVCAWAESGAQSQWGGRGRGREGAPSACWEKLSLSLVALLETLQVEAVVGGWGHVQPWWRWG